MKTSSSDAEQPFGESKEIVVFIIRRDTKCGECGEELGKGRWIRLEGDELLMSHGDRQLARTEVWPEIERVLVRWEKPS